MENNEEITMKKVKRTTSKEKIQKLEAEIIELTNKLKEAENKHLLALADLENLRKRFIKEKNIIQFKTTEKVLQPFLTIYQHFQMAIEAMQHNANIESITQGLSIIANSFTVIFQDLNLEVINSVNKQFDPSVHNAVSKQYSDTIQEGYIISQWTPGFKWNGKLMKPASVVVSMGKKPID